MTVINGLPAHALLHFLVVLAPLAWHSSAWREARRRLAGIDPRRPAPWPWPRAGPAFGLLMPNALFSPML
jgi:hypothetical protein